MTLKMLDTFAGIGGFSYAAKYLIDPGIETAGFVEIDPFCQKILLKNFPNIPIHDDITTFTARPFQYDIISGGFPCQDISVAGRQKGITQTTRSGLFYELIRVIRMVRPKYVILENVAAILNNGLDIVLAEFYEAGYDAEWATFPASLIGAAHQRDRWWLVAYPIGIRSKSQSKIQTRRNSSSSSHRSRDVADSNKRSCTSQKQCSTLDRKNEGLRLDNENLRDVADSNNNGSSRTTESRSTQETNGRSEERKDFFIESKGSSKSQNSRDFQQSSSNSKSSDWDGYETQQRDGKPRTQEISRDRNSSKSSQVWRSTKHRLNPKWREYVSKPCLLRGDDGLQDRVDRLKALGNSIVPQCAAIPLQRVIQLEREQQ